MKPYLLSWVTHPLAAALSRNAILSQASGLAKQQKHTEHLTVIFSVTQVSLLFLATSPRGLTLCMQQRTTQVETACAPDKGVALAVLMRKVCYDPAGQEEIRRNTQIAAPVLSNPPSLIPPWPLACPASSHTTLTHWNEKLTRLAFQKARGLASLQDTRRVLGGSTCQSNNVSM